MKVIRDEKLATYTLVPIDKEEEEILISIIKLLKVGDGLSYGGRGRDGDDDKFCMVHLHAGARRERQTKTEGNSSVTRWVHIGGVELLLRGSTEDDKYEVNGIRNICYFGSGGLIFLGEIEVNGKKAIVVTAKYCKVCGRAMINLVACEWSVCDDCDAKCEHAYVRGAVHGGGLEIGVREFCQKCGRVKPKSKGESMIDEKSQLDHHLAVERELGFKVVYKDTLLTPSQIDYLRKVVSAPYN